MKKLLILIFPIVLVYLFLFSTPADAQPSPLSISANYGTTADSNTAVNPGIQISGGVASDNLQIVVSAPHGTLTIPPVNGLSGVSGNGTGCITIAGNYYSVNTLLSLMTYISISGFSGTETIYAEATDLSSSQTGSVQVPILISNMPHVAVPGAISVLSNSDLHLSGVSITYPSTSGGLPVTLSVSHGIITLPSPPGSMT